MARMKWSPGRGGDWYPGMRIGQPTLTSDGKAVYVSYQTHRLNRGNPLYLIFSEDELHDLMSLFHERDMEAQYRRDMEAAFGPYVGPGAAK